MITTNCVLLLGALFNLLPFFPPEVFWSKLLYSFHVVYPKFCNKETIDYLTEVSHRPKNIDYLEVKGLSYIYIAISVSTT